MKKLLSLFAAAVLFPVAANADVLSNVNLKGDIQVIASDVNHNVDGAYKRGTSARVLAGLSADLVEDVTANLMFQYAYQWGDDNDHGFANGKNVRLVNANVVLHNLFCCLEATVGRQFYGDEDSAVMYIGPNHYNAEFNGLTNALDAAKITYGDDFKSFTLIAGRIVDVDDEVDATGTMDKVKATLIGADLKLNLTDALKFQVYGYNINNLKFTDTSTTPATEWDVEGNGGFYGAKLAFAPEAFRVSAEYARNYGFRHTIFKEEKSTGHMAKVDIAADIEAVTVRGAALYANANFWAFGNYTPGLLIGHRLGGDIFDYTDEHGVAMFNIGFDVKPADKWTVSLDGFSFQDHRMKHSSTWEADLTAKYDHNEYVQLFAGVGYANYTSWEGTEFNKDNFDKDNVKGQLGMLIKF